MSNSLFLDNLLTALYDPLEPIHLRYGGELTTHGDPNISGIIPPIAPGNFGSKAFRKEFTLRFAYVAGAMVGGISSCAMVEALAEADLLGIFGASGLSPQLVEESVVRLKTNLPGKSFGSCLIHTPHDPELERKIVDIYLNQGVSLVEASAFLQISPALVLYRLKGIHELPDGHIIVPNRVMAKCSRLELARRFFSPPPEKIVKKLLEDGLITETEAELSRYIPMAQDLTAEADSGGHTDFRPAITLWPSMLQLAEEYTLKFDYLQPLRVGAAGGLGTPQALEMAQNMGCAYFVTGSINQSSVESGLSSQAKELLAKAIQTDVATAPAADMFEMGAKVQVLKYGTLFAPRANKLAEIYRIYGSVNEIPELERASLEEKIFKKPLRVIWEETEAFFKERDPSQLKKAENPKYKMALIFRWYLGQASRWAIQGVEERRTDWSIFTGPAMGAFNEWSTGSYFEDPSNRKVVDMAMNLLYGLAVLKRVSHARDLGLIPDDLSIPLKPLPPDELAEYISVDLI
ncbi:MAG: PfaD family polyunsaturated fatty acid/polyketide biosynthesis protein [Deltaproteobacteria bacterium]|jgi:PfaD family protein|nr:PfaD family polyunsaturated fatty acid/polyketide biosynthesis protein [Deltaproteobacteria bacterium]